VQNVNRRTGRRRTLQIAEILPNGDPRILMQLNPIRDKLEFLNEPLAMLETLSLYTGMSKSNIYSDLKSKIKILKWMASRNVININKIGLIMSRYYQDRPIIESKGV
jgi:hypothetical protein